MKYLILFLMLSTIAIAQTHDVGQTNANVDLALTKALAQPDSNTAYRSFLEWLNDRAVADSTANADSIAYHLGYLQWLNDRLVADSTANADSISAHLSYLQWLNTRLVSDSTATHTDFYVADTIHIGDCKIYEINGELAVADSAGNVAIITP